MSGLSRTPGKRVRVNSPSGVRIPLSPPKCPRKRAFVFGGERAQALRPVRGDEKGRACKARLAGRGVVVEGSPVF